MTALLSLAWKQLVRHRLRTTLTVLGVASGMFLFTSVETLQHSLANATEETAADTTLVVYRENRFCPAHSVSTNTPSKSKSTAEYAMPIRGAAEADGQADILTLLFPPTRARPFQRMARRLKALFMLLIVGLVLPAAGSPQRLCTRSMAFLASDQACDCSGKDCHDCPDESHPTKPSCVASADVLPDVVNPEQISLPSLVVVIVPAFSLPEPAEVITVPVVSITHRDRAPPDPALPLYLSQRSLLL